MELAITRGDEETITAFDPQEQHAQQNADGGEFEKRLHALQAEKDRLQALVCYLVHVNEQLRDRNKDGESPDFVRHPKT